MKINDFLEKYAAYAIIAVGTLIMLYIAIAFEGTGDDGDSIQHYMFARWAFEHHNNFFEQWAKPIFVLIAAPIAQLGFGAMKLFNVFVLAATQLFSYWTAKKLGLKNAWLVPFFIAIAPMSIYLTPSGLTEPFWALWFIVSIYLAVNQRLVAATLLLSFLPFVRSEGLIILCVFAPYLFFKKRYELIPLLLFGHIVYMIAGAGAHDGDYFWVFKNMSYATLNSGYGSGSWSTFYKGLNMVMGTAMAYFWRLGMIVGAVRLLLYWFKEVAFSKEELWLVYGTSTAYFVGHSAFWALGLFNSFGLLRVIVGIMPVFVIVILFAFNFLQEKINEKDTRLGSIFTIVSLILIAFSAWRWTSKGHFALSNEQLAVQKALKDIGSKANDATLYFDGTSVPYFLGTDYFSDKKHRHCDRLLNGERIPANALIFWDSWFSLNEYKVPLEKLQKNPQLKQIGTYTEENPDFGKPRTICVFERDTSVFKLNSLIYQNDFENVEKNENKKTDESKAVFGKKSLILDQNNPYSTGFDGYISGIKNDKEEVKFRLSSKVWLSDINPKDAPKVVVDILRNGKSIKWQGWKLTDFISVKEQWADLNFQHEIKENEIKAGDKIKIFIWNDTASSIWLDDLKIELLD